MSTTYPTEQQLDARLKKVERELEELQHLAASLRNKDENIERRTNNISNSTTKANLLQNRINRALARAVLTDRAELEKEDISMLQDLAEQR